MRRNRRRAINSVDYEGKINTVTRTLTALFVLSLAIGACAGNKTVFIYYYPWYGNQAYDGQWMHWQENGHQPPTDIASSFYPKLGPYSSRDLYVIDQHMRWIAEARVNVLIYSWWGRNDYTDEIAKTVLDAAADYNLKLAFLIEPYPGRTPRGICNDIEYLTKKYENHPAFYKTHKATLYDAKPGLRPMFFIYNPDFEENEMRMVSDEIHASAHDSILLLQSTDADLIDQTHVDGLFAYEAVLNVMDFYKGLIQTIRKKSSIFIPCVSPGFNGKAIGTKVEFLRPRLQGQRYDQWWSETIAANPQFIAIISFNEWHEGTQIEPAVPAHFDRNYASYISTYGKTGAAAERSYLARTARWIDVFQQMTP